jgi:protocatechuate 3,4-dioxygenase alpha subunit
MSPLTLTGAQTVGPFFAICLTRDDRPDSLKNVLLGPDTEGERIRIEGQVLDGDRQPVPDAMVEIWQANAHGRYNHPADTRQELPLDPTFTGFGRSATDEEGLFWFDTVKPGRVPGPDGQPQAPHIVVSVFARGLLNHAVTRLYFADDPVTQADPVLQRVPADRRETLLAQPTGAESAQRFYRFDIRLQGERETAFFNV